ncbi:unnamed protein product (mitochondrion) [Plasmodiophora brassicae]|uniref:Uncharacterized protein n=1 Tax=Plasmodiophora brassicae TaxID=37360 RepID=A0A3P3YA47_PLABS|nr:unnamed protein product [Plasmodiophora brassicae]
MTSPTDSASGYTSGHRDLLPADPECMGHDVDAVMSDCPSSSASRSHSYCCDPPTRLQPVLYVELTRFDARAMPHAIRLHDDLPATRSCKSCWSAFTSASVARRGDTIMGEPVAWRVFVYRILVDLVHVSATLLALLARRPEPSTGTLHSLIGTRTSVWRHGSDADRTSSIAPLAVTIRPVLFSTSVCRLNNDVSAVFTSKHYMHLVTSTVPMGSIIIVMRFTTPFDSAILSIIRGVVA